MKRVLVILFLSLSILVGSQAVSQNISMAGSFVQLGEYASDPGWSYSVDLESDGGRSRADRTVFVVPVYKTNGVDELKYHYCFIKKDGIWGYHIVFIDGNMHRQLMDGNEPVEGNDVATAVLKVLLSD